MKPKGFIHVFFCADVAGFDRPLSYSWFHDYHSSTVMPFKASLGITAQGDQTQAIEPLLPHFSPDPQMARH
jgi:hypothetical protein